MKRTKYGKMTTPEKKRGKPTYPVKTGYKKFGAVPRSLVQYSTGFPKQLKITHRYTTTFNLVFSGPSFNALTLSYGVNCLYDPQLSIGGNQPLYFDQVASIYNHYTVLKSRMTLSLSSNSADGYVAGIYIDDDATPLQLLLDTIVEQPSAIYKHGSRDNGVIYLNKTWDCKSVFGPSPLDNDELQGNVSANPQEIQAFTLFVRPVNGGVTSGNYDGTVVIEYDTIWHELRSIASS